MVIINGTKFYEQPTSCGTCPFLFIQGRNTPSILPSSTSVNATHHCKMWDEWHRSYKSVPRQCEKLFRKAFKFPEGTELAIVINDGTKE